MINIPLLCMIQMWNNIDYSNKNLFMDTYFKTSIFCFLKKVKHTPTVISFLYDSSRNKNILCESLLWHVVSLNPFFSLCCMHWLIFLIIYCNRLHFTHLAAEVFFSRSCGNWPSSENLFPLGWEMGQWVKPLTFLGGKSVILKVLKKIFFLFIIY